LKDLQSLKPRLTNGLTTIGKQGKTTASTYLLFT
jgi:hypothetical protein